MACSEARRNLRFLKGVEPCCSNAVHPCVAIAALAIAVVNNPLWAETRPAITTIAIKGMHCQGCASKVAARLKEVPGVANANVDAMQGMAIVHPGGRKPPSPRAQWEAVELAGFKPVQLAGPYGTFTSKPQF